MGENQTISNHDLAEEDEKEQIRKYFKYKKNGTCVEVGSNEPLSICSQSWHLENKLNWTCVLVEPNPELVTKTIKVRPNAIIHNCACTSGEKSGDYMDLHIPLSNNGEIITSHASLEKNVDDHNYNKHRSIHVKTELLTNILKQDSIKSIDFLSIDVEGTELDVLKGINLQTYQPKLILIEDKHLYLTKHRYLKGQGYILVRRLNGNCWYIPRGAPIPKVKLKDRLKLIRRLYLSIWYKKLKYSLTHKTLRPFKTL